MLSDKRIGQCVKLWLAYSLRTVVFAIEFADIQKHDNKKIECPKRCLFDRKSSITIRCIPALDLNPNLRQFSNLEPMPWIGVDTN